MSNSRPSQSIPPFAQSKKKHLVILMSLGCILLGLSVSYIFLWQTISDGAAKLAALRMTESQEKTRVLYMRGEKLAVRDTKDERARLDTYFMDERSVAGFLGTVESVGRELGLGIETISLGVFEGKLRANVHAEGTFSPLARFVSLLEKMPFKLSLTRLVMSAGEEERWALDVDLSVSSFLVPEQQ